jgi:glycosyltransferase involved in cell wall biosynthesis
VFFKTGLKSVLALLGKGETKVAAVFGVSPERCQQAVRHLKTGAPGVPVWLFATVAPLPETAAMCERVYVRRSSLRLFFEAQARLWPCAVAIAVGTWTSEPGRWPVKLAPFFIPPFRTLLLNSWGGFFPGKPGLVLLHVSRFLRAGAFSHWVSSKEIAHGVWMLLSRHMWHSAPVHRTQEIAAGVWALVSYHIWRSGPVRRVSDVGGGIWELMSYHMWRSSSVRRIGDVSRGVSLSSFSTLLRWLGYPQRAWFRRIHGDRSLLLPVMQSLDGVERFVQKGPSWNGLELTWFAQASPVRWILWQREGTAEPSAGELEEMAHLFSDPRTFAVVRQTQARGWKPAMLPMGPFRELQPGTATQVMAPLGDTILIDRAKLAALGVPRTGLTQTAWMLAFWKAAAAGWRCYAVPGGESGGWQPDFPEPEAAFFLRILNDWNSRTLGPQEPRLSRGNITFAPQMRLPLRRGKLRVVLVTPFLPYPLAHGGAVRIFNLCRELADRVDFVLIAIREAHETVEFEKLHEVFREVYTVDLDERIPDRPVSKRDRRPRQVRAAESSSLRALIGSVCDRVQPDLLQIEFTHMAAYRDAAPEVPAILVEHDLTFDLYCQLAEANPSAAAWAEYQHWLDFERLWLAIYTAVWTVSEADRRSAIMAGSAADRTFVVANGVDVRRFQPGSDAMEADPSEVFFVGSFRHLPNVLAFEKLRDQIMPLVWKRIPDARLRVVAGPRHEFFWKSFAKTGARMNSDPRIEIHGYVEDLRPLYARATVVVAPLEVSAGTNIKVLEAMACAKSVVSTPAGCAGLDLVDGEDAFIRENCESFAEAICETLSNADLRRSVGARAREAAEQRFSWSSLADHAYSSYMHLTGLRTKRRVQKAG